MLAAVAATLLTPGLLDSAVRLATLHIDDFYSGSYGSAASQQIGGCSVSNQQRERSRLQMATMMAMSEEEKARAYQEQVKRAEAMAKNPSLRPASKPLFEIPGFKAPWDKQEDDGMDLKAKFQQAAKGWNAAVEKQKAVNRGEEAFAAEVAEEAAAETEAATEDADAAARIAELEAQMEALRKQMKE